MENKNNNQNANKPSLDENKTNVLETTENKSNGNKKKKRRVISATIIVFVIIAAILINIGASALDKKFSLSLDLTKNHFFKVTYVHNSIGKTFKVCKDFPFFFLEYDIVNSS